MAQLKIKEQDILERETQSTKDFVSGLTNFDNAGSFNSTMKEDAKECVAVPLSDRIRDKIKHHYATIKELEWHLKKLENTEAEKVIKEAEIAFYSHF